MEAAETIRIYVRTFHTAGVGYSVYVDSNLQLQYRGTDFTLFANTGYVDNPLDSGLLMQIMRQLFSPSVPVTRVDVTPFGMHIYANTTADPQKIIEKILLAASLAEYKVDFKKL